MCTLVERALPDVRDGLKPSQRRILVAMNDLSLSPGGSTTKCVGIVGETMKRFSIDQPPNALMTPYETADGWVAVAVIHPDQWPALASAIGLDELLDDARFTRFGHALKNTDALLPILQERFRERTTDEWWRVLRDAGVWAGPVNRVQDLAQDAHVLANEYLVTFPDGFVGPPAPYEVDGWRGSRGVAAEHGEHTDEVLRELGYDDDGLLELRARSTIW